jgi:hypothetical protein
MRVDQAKHRSPEPFGILVLLLAQESHPNEGLISVTRTGMRALRIHLGTLWTSRAVVEGERARILRLLLPPA